MKISSGSSNFMTHAQLVGERGLFSLLRAYFVLTIGIIIVVVASYLVILAATYIGTR